MKGIHREHRIPMGDAALVTDGTISMYLVESRYKTSGYEPAWEALEWAEASVQEDAPRHASAVRRVTDVYEQAMKRIREIAWSGCYPTAEAALRNLAPKHRAVLQSSMSAADRLAIQQLCEQRQQQRR